MNRFSYQQVRGVKGSSSHRLGSRTYLTIPGNFRTMYSVQSGRVLALKGYHPNLKSFESLVSSCLAKQTQTTLFDDLLFLEGKLPGLLTLEEASREYEKGKNFITDYKKNFNREPLVAKPVEILELSEVYRDQVIRCAESLLRGERKQRYLGLLERQKIAVLISATQKLPMRLKYRSLIQDSKICKNYTKKNPMIFEKTWSSVFMTSKAAFEMGYALISPLDRVHGSCLDLQNVTIYGEICDMDSIHRMRDFSWPQGPDQFKAALLEALSRILREFGLVNDSNQALASGLIHEHLFLKQSSPKEILKRLMPFLS